MRITRWAVLSGLLLLSLASFSQTPRAQKKYDEAMRDVDYLRTGMPGPTRYRILEKVEKLLREATTDSPDWAPAHAQLGIARFGLQQINPAIQSFARARELDLAKHGLPDELRRRAMDIYGEALARNGQYEQSIKLYDDLIKEDPEYGGYEYNLACAYSESGKLDKALPHLKRAWELRGSFDFPDPRKDSSFSRWLNDPRFEEVVRNMVI